MGSCPSKVFLDITNTPLNREGKKLRKFLGQPFESQRSVKLSSFNVRSINT